MEALVAWHVVCICIYRDVYTILFFLSLKEQWIGLHGTMHQPQIKIQEEKQSSSQCHSRVRIEAHETTC